MLRITACIASLAGALFLAAPAAAAPGGKTTTTSSISLVQPSAGLSALAATGPSYGDMVTFDVKTDATARPFVNLKCYQDGVLVAEGWDGFFDGALGDRLFGLGSERWTGGAADCTAYLDMWAKESWKQLASTSFHVDA
jgi:hypothetical protein